MSLELTRLDDRRFQELFEEARALIPRFAPRWTDHNTHDTGITLIELMTWLVDGQLYRLDRLSRDQRHSFMRLLGHESEGALAAQVDLWPTTRRSLGGRTIRARTVFAARERSKNLRFELEHDVTLSRSSLISIASVLNGDALDRTQVNEQVGIHFPPFGADGSGVLRLRFDPPLEEGQLALFVRVQTDSLRGDLNGGPPTVPSARLTWSALNETRILMPLEFEDETWGLLRSGFVRLTIPVGGVHELRLSIESGGYASAPEIEQIGMNVLRCKQIETAPEDELLGTGTGDPDLTLHFEEAGRLIGEPAIQTIVGGTRTQWKAVGSLAESGPNESHFVLDRETQTICFGNGVNGRVPPEGVPIVCSACKRTAGKAGNLVADLNWSIMTGPLVGLFGTNPDPATGGKDAETVDDLEERSLRSLRDVTRAITEEDIRSIALATPGVRVARVGVLFGQDPRLGCMPAPGQTTVVAVAYKDDHGSESEGFLASIRNELESKRLIGDSFHVVGPHYVDFDLAISLILHDRVDSGQVTKNVKDELERKLAPIAEVGVEDKGWPLGRDVFATELLAWVDQVSGVDAVLELTFLVAGEERSRVLLRPTALPRMVRCDIELIRREQLPTEEDEA